MSEVILFKILPYLVYTLSIILAGVAGLLVYTGLSSKHERVQNRIRLQQNIIKSRKLLVQKAGRSKAETWLKEAQYPLGLTGLKYYLIIGILISFLISYYIVLPVFIDGGIDNSTLLALLLIITVVVVFSPNVPFSLFSYLMKKVIEFHKAKKQAEIFMLYDLLINEIEMMNVHRINTYNILRNIKPYFDVLDKDLTRLLSSWSSDEGPKAALTKFENELDSKESQALVGVIKNLDDLDQQTALNHLRGMHSMFVKSQIENYRRKRKLTTDLLGIPIKATHFLIILNFVVVIVTMVSIILSTSRL